MSRLVTQHQLTGLAAVGILIVEFLEHSWKILAKDSVASRFNLLNFGTLVIPPVLTLQRFEPGKEIFEERVVDISTLGMILDR
jgi:hypothetical protein